VIGAEKSGLAEYRWNVQGFRSTPFMERISEKAVWVAQALAHGAERCRTGTEQCTL